MGLLGTRWEADFEGIKLAVVRNEWTKGFKLEKDGAEIASRLWSLVGLGELQTSMEVGARSVEVKVVIYWGGISEMDGKCMIVIDGTEIPVRHVK